MSKSLQSALAHTKRTEVSYENPTIQIGRTLFWITFVAATVVLSIVVSREIFVGLVRPASERSATPIDGRGLVLPAEPRLEGFEKVRSQNAMPAASDEARIQKYAWVDRDKKIVSIPIDQALNLAIEQEWLRSAEFPAGNRTKPALNSNSSANRLEAQ